MDLNQTFNFDIESSFTFVATDIEMSIYRKSGNTMKLVASSENIDWENEIT